MLGVNYSLRFFRGIAVQSDFYIAIEGPIGVGKTTLARILREELGGQLLLEVFEENPFLSDFYADRARYAFQTQIFFLLSRYRQQNEVVSRALQMGPLVSDYIFAKDRLFAHLNLAGDELAVYERVHVALGEKIPIPTLVVHLRASTDVLMNRIAFRDRSYERTMSRQYIDDLRLAYERFFADYDQAPVLNVDTDNLNFVASLEDRRHIVGVVRSTLRQGMFQQPLPEVTAALGEVGGRVLRKTERGLGDFQRWHQQMDQEKGFIPDLYLNYLGLTEKLGELGKQLRILWITHTAAEYRRHEVALQEAFLRPSEVEEQNLREATERLRGELADVLAYLLKLANDAGVDLEEAYVAKMGDQHQQLWSGRG